MKNITIPLGTLLLGLLIWTGCGSGSENNSDTPGPGPKTGQEPAPSTSDVGPSDPDPSTSDVGPSDPDPSFQQVPTGPQTFSQLVDLFVAELAGDEYKEIKIQPMDQVPHFSEANEAIFLRFQKRQPILGRKEMKVFPRFFLKCYRFGDEAAADMRITKWLNDFDSTADSIALGQEVKAVKSPPAYCGLREECFFLLQTSCIYQGESQDALKERFFSWMEQSGGRMGWEIGCNAGHLSYHFQREG